MKHATSTILDTLQVVALALWLGGLAIFWLALVPTVGQGAEPAALLGRVWNEFGVWFERSGLAMVGVQFLLRRRYHGNRPRFVADGIRQLLTFAALVLAEYGLRGSSGVSPFAAPAGFHTLEAVSAMQTLLLVAIAGLTVWLQNGGVVEPRMSMERRGRRQ